MATKRTKPAMTIRQGNDGLTVRINLWSMKRYLQYFDSYSASLAIAGEVKREGHRG